MHLKPKSTNFDFILSSEQLFSSLDHIKLHNYEHFINLGQIGKQVQMLAKDQQNIAQIESIVQQNYADLQYLQLQLTDAFISALHLRNEPVVKYFLDNGIKLDKIQPGCLLELCYSLEYLRHDPPVELLKILLEYGGNARYAQNDNSDTPMHVAAKYGTVQFLQLLLEYGADINAVNNEKMTPLGCAIAGNNKQAAELLKAKGGHEKWDQ